MKKVTKEVPAITQVVAEDTKLFVLDDDGNIWYFDYGLYGRSEWVKMPGLPEIPTKKGTTPNE